VKLYTPLNEIEIGGRNVKVFAKSFTSLFSQKSGNKYFKIDENSYHSHQNSFT